jgi:hypothetical protein
MKCYTAEPLRIHDSIVHNPFSSIKFNSFPQFNLKSQLRWKRVENRYVNAEIQSMDSKKTGTN